MWNYMLNVRTEVVAARLELNDVPRWDRPGAADDSLSATVNPWITAGRNTLRLTIDWPEGLSYEPGRARVELCLEARSASPGSTESRVLARAQWPGKAEEAYPAAVALAFDVREAPPSRLWTSATPIELTPETQVEIRDLASRLHAAIAVRDVDRSCELLDFRTTDIAQTVYKPAGEARTAQRDALTGLFSPDVTFQLQPLYPAELELHPVAGSRMIWVTRPNRAPVVEMHGADGRSTISMYAARIGGAWEIVR